MLKKVTALTLGLVLTATPACAQHDAAPAPTVAKPALWMVKDQDTTIYLFGTIHVLKPGLTWFDGAVKNAFDHADTLVLELVMPDPATMQALVMKLGTNQDAKTLPEKLSPTEQARYTKALTDLSVPVHMMDHFDPWLAATELSILPLAKLGYGADNGPETVLSNAAKAAGKPIIGLETAEQQLGYLDGLPQPAQLSFLTSTLDDAPKAKDEFDAMVHDWSTGDPEALAKIMNDDLNGQPQLKQALLTDRNARWADWIVERLKTPGTVFVAVGAGHLAGAGSVIADLRAKGETVTRVPN
jgi:uncharacterized protein YbaP (TraB family)